MDARLPVLVIVVPLLAAMLAALIGRRWRPVAYTLALGATAFSLYGAIRLLWLLSVMPEGAERVIRYAMGNWAAPTGIEYRVDVLNAIVLVMVSAVAFLAVVWGRPTISREIRRAGQGSWYAIVLLFTAGMLGITITGDIFNLYVFLEIASITSYVLVGMGKRREGLFAGYTYLILGSIGATFVLIGIGHLYMATGSLGMEDVASRIAAADAAHPRVLHTAFAFIAVGLAVKMALFPLHAWQPGAYTHAPSMASLLLAATATKVAAYAFYRFVFTVFGPEYVAAQMPEVLDGLMVMAAAAMIVGPLLAIRQRNFKRMLAYSSVGQIGYVLLGAVLLSPDGEFSVTAMTGSIVHFWNHAASKGALFAVAGLLAVRAGTTKVDDLNGLGRRAPWTAVAMTVAALSLIGIPLTGGFITKYYLVLGSFESGRWILVPIMLVSSLLTAVYMGKCLQRVWFPAADAPVTVGRDGPWVMRIPTLVLAASCLGFGIAAFLPVGLAAEAAQALLGGR